MSVIRFARTHAASALLVVLPVVVSAAPAEESAAEREFLSLPLVSLEEEASPGGGVAELRIGDELNYKVSGVPAAVGVRPAPKAGTFLDQGASVRVVRTGDPAIVGVAPLRADAAMLEPIVLVDAQGKDIARTDPLKLPPVKSAIDATDPKAGEAAPARAPVAVGFPAWLIGVLSVGGLALAVAVVRGLIRLRERWKSRKPVVADVPVVSRTPDALALEELALLEAKRHPEAGRFKPHYFGISETLKKYIAARYGFDAMESTSHEVIVELERRGATMDGLLDRLERSFERLDRVKFTDHVPEAEEPALLLEEAREFIRRTRRALEAPPILPAEGKGP